MFFDKKIDDKFLKIEKKVLIIGIPFFTIMTFLFIISFPLESEKKLVFFRLIFPFIGITCIWFTIRFIIFINRKYFSKYNFKTRLFIQLLVSSLVAILVTWILQCIHIDIVMKGFGIIDTDHNDDKNLIITSILFAFLINALYESFYLILRLSETAIETERYKKESVEAKYQNLTSRLNPHFLFNSLNTLTTIVEENPKKAVTYIQELSIVYRFVLNSHKSTWIELSQELVFAQSYILLLKMRFETNLLISLDICEKYVNQYILPLTLQLLIENAVKHNEISDSHPLEIKIFCAEDILIVSNNKQKRTIMPSTTKIGLHNICERYRFLTKKELIIEDTNDSFTVKIPLLKISKNSIEPPLNE